MKYTHIRGLLSKTIILFLVAIIVVSCSKGHKEIISYYKNGNPKLVYFTKMQDGIKTKVYEKMYYENGKLCYKGGCINNEKTGVWKFYYDNGKKFGQWDYT